MTVTAAGLVVGTLLGIFGVGGSSFATPLLALAGVPPLIAIASPLPATIPAALSAAAGYWRRGEVDVRIALLSVAGGMPATVFGAAASGVVGGGPLLLLSGIVLGLVGLRVLAMGPAPASAATGRPPARAGLVVGAAVVVGFLSGILANGGGFLLVPLYLVVLGLGMRRASGTSLVVVSALAVPTLAAHWALGHIDLEVALAFGAGAIPAATVMGRVAGRVSGDRARQAFGVLLVGFAVWFTATRVVT